MMTCFILGCMLTISLIAGYAAHAEMVSDRMLPVVDRVAEPQTADVGQKADVMRVIQVDLDYVYDTDAEQETRNLDALIRRVKDMKISTVFLQAFADPEGTGLASALYFPNNELPMRADLFSQVVTRLKDDAGVKVFGWLPVLSFDFGPSVTPVMAWDAHTDKASVDTKAYHRASLFDAAARFRISEIYENMARQAPIDGVLFHDDALLSDFEDASPAAMTVYHRAGFPSSMRAIHSNLELKHKWMVFKTNALIAFTQDLANHVRLYRPAAQTVRNIYARAVLEPESQEWFAQDYDRFLEAYNYTAIEAMPRMENVPEDQSDSWLQHLVAVAAERSNGLQHTIFELQSVDWNKAAQGEDRAIPTDELSAEMRLLARAGALNFGYYPDDFMTNTPDADMLHEDFSLQTYPYRP